MRYGIYSSGERALKGRKGSNLCFVAHVAHNLRVAYTASKRPIFLRHMTRHRNLLYLHNVYCIFVLNAG